jgi:hypothetical protein
VQKTGPFLISLPDFGFWNQIRKLQVLDCVNIDSAADFPMSSPADLQGTRSVLYAPGDQNGDSDLTSESLKLDLRNGE